MNNTVKLEKYLPEYIQEYREMLKIMQAENPEFQLAENESEVLKNNLFIQTCDEKGISRFESIMGITPLDSDSLESRISRVFTRWNEQLPYTFKFLLSKLNSLCGTDNYEIERNIDEYKMSITTFLELSGQVDELNFLLDSIMPANIELNVENHINIEAICNSNFAAGLIYCSMFDLTDNFKSNFEINGGQNVGSAVINTIEINLTDNFKSNIEIDGTENVATIINICESLQI